jgi:hypothetical protein
VDDIADPSDSRAGDVAKSTGESSADPVDTMKFVCRVLVCPVQDSSSTGSGVTRGVANLFDETVVSVVGETDKDEVLELRGQARGRSSATIDCFARKVAWIFSFHQFLEKLFLADLVRFLAVA